MLTATPYNKHYKDLSAQLRLFIGDDTDLGIRPEAYIRQIGGERAFSSKNNLLTVPDEMKIYTERAKNYYNRLIDKNNVQWIDSRYFKRTLKQGLKKDCDQLIAMISLCEAWNPQTDQKLGELEKLLNKDHKDDKVIVFTQYSDTANYVYSQLKKRGVKHIEKVTGETKNPTSIVERFSPLSNKANISTENELRILIATDVLSEGQNLQDAHIIVNYDLPWAIIRLIQRAGRVDRIDQSSLYALQQSSSNKQKLLFL